MGTTLALPISGATSGVLWFAPPIASAGSALAGVLIDARGRLSSAGFVGVAVAATAFFVWPRMSTVATLDDVSGEMLDGPCPSALVAGPTLTVASLYAGRRYRRRRQTVREARPVA